MTTAPDTRTVALRPLGVAEILDASVRVVRRNVRACFAVTLPVAVLGTAVGSLVTYASLDDESLVWTQLLVQLFVGSVTSVLLGGLLTPLFTSEVVDGRPFTGGVLRRLGPSAFPLVALSAVVAFGLEVGVVALVVGGVWLWGVWAVAAPALVSERLGPLGALRRSAELARGAFWRIWGVRALCRVATTVLGSVVGIPFTLLAALLADSDPFDADASIGNAGVYVTVVSLGTVISQLLLAPVEAATDTLLYVDARMRREGLDLVLALDGDLAAPPPVRGAASW